MQRKTETPAERELRRFQEQVNRLKMRGVGRKRHQRETGGKQPQKG
jgi:hypothetical protein